MLERASIAWLAIISDSDDGNIFLTCRGHWLIKLKALVGCLLPYREYNDDYWYTDLFEIASLNEHHGWHPEWGEEFTWDSILIRPGWKGWRLSWYSNSNL